ncbi:MAG: radical SAM protein [Chlamydiae bacterium]|nr:radical SAM protein [Chlamydiota bacterium]
MNAVTANSKGDIFERPGFLMTGRSGDLYRLPLEEELIDLPTNTQVTFLPKRIPILWNQNLKKPQLDPTSSEKENLTAGAILPIGYLRTLLPATAPVQKDFLPQWAYAAIGRSKKNVMGAAIRIDSSDRWENHHYNTPGLLVKIERRLSKEPQNRILKQLALCASEYHCNTAQNIFYERWEGALPVSPACNAQCVGCISLQPEELPPSSHQRINFAPYLEEVLPIALSHLEKSEDAILSFGQGCEGEPLLVSNTIEKALKEIRLRTSFGTLNLNTNASRPHDFLKLCQAGLESVRISMNSAIPETYAAYYQPRGYDFKEVVETAHIARENGLAISINLLTFPGVTDREEEAKALITFIHQTKINAIQWRNLAIDPDQYLLALPKRKGNILGLTTLLKILRKEFPNLHHLSFSRPKEFFNENPKIKHQKSK